MKIRALSVRVGKDLLRDPINLCFGLGFPLALLFLFSAFRSHVPGNMFAPERITPGVAVFGLSFLTLFSATLIARDRESALLQRLYTAPLTAWDFIAGYTLPLLPLAVLQCAICYAAGLALGLPFSGRIFTSVLLILPVSLLYIALGLLCGTALSVRQTGAVCGALLTNLSAWLSGIWFDVGLVGGVFEKIAGFLPFLHAVEMERAACCGDLSAILPHLIWVIGYAAAVWALAVLLFSRQIRKQ